MTQMWLQRCLILLVISTCMFPLAQSTPIRRLKDGSQIRGRLRSIYADNRVKSVNEYLGIPYALPPTGSLRFVNPQPHPGWSDVINATERPASCWQPVSQSQFERTNAASRMWLNNTEMSEDCLYLNVWEPLVQSEEGPTSVPIMVWIYGGAFSSGTSTLDVYDGHILASKEQVVVVSMQYRLGPFGFLRLAGSDGNDNSIGQGNQALFDILTAVKWIEKNAAAFGGDASRITLFGESSGAASAGLLALSPLASKHFSRLIMQSGSPYARWALTSVNEAHETAAIFANKSGCPSNAKRSEIIECLQALDPSVLLHHTTDVWIEKVKMRRREMLMNLFNNSEMTELPGSVEHARPYFDVLFKPVIDGVLLTQPLNKAFDAYTSQDNKFPDLLLGVNKNEAIHFLISGLQSDQLTFLQPDGTVRIPDDFTAIASRQPTSNGKVLDLNWFILFTILDPDLARSRPIAFLPTLYYNIPIAPLISHSPYSYADPVKVKLTGEQLIGQLDDLASDLEFVCPALNYADQAARLNQSRVFVYQFEHRTESSPIPPWVGTMHGAEIAYVFGAPRSPSFQKRFYAFTNQEMEFSDQVMKLWANFAKHGNPSIAGNLDWPPYIVQTEAGQNNAEQYLILANQSRTSTGLRKSQCRFWLHGMEYLKRITDLSNDASRSRNSLLLIIFMSIFHFISYYSSFSLVPSPFV